MGFGNIWRQVWLSHMGMGWGEGAATPQAAPQNTEPAGSVGSSEDKSAPLGSS